jgi:hypothetical protein
MHLIADEYLISCTFVGEYGHLAGDWVTYWLVHSEATWDMHCPCQSGLWMCILYIVRRKNEFHPQHSSRDSTGEPIHMDGYANTGFSCGIFEQLATP